MDKLYDVIILGAGPAGLAAGLYSGRYRLSTLIIEKAKDGGQIAITDEIENYPGQMVEGESGPSLIARMTQQAEKFGVRYLSSLPVRSRGRSVANARVNLWVRAFLSALPVTPTSSKIWRSMW